MINLNKQYINNVISNGDYVQDVTDIIVKSQLFLIYIDYKCINKKYNIFNDDSIFVALKDIINIYKGTNKIVCAYTLLEPNNMNTENIFSVIKIDNDSIYHYVVGAFWKEIIKRIYIMSENDMPELKILLDKKINIALISDMMDIDFPKESEEKLDKTSSLLDYVLFDLVKTNSIEEIYKFNFFMFIKEEEKKNNIFKKIKNVFTSLGEKKSDRKENKSD